MKSSIGKFILLALLPISFAWGQNLSVLKVSNDNRKILIPRDSSLQNGSTVYIIAPGQGRVDAIAVVKGCNANGCVAEVGKRRRGVMISSSYIVSTTAPGQRVAKAKESNNLLAQTQKETRPKNNDDAQYIGLSLGGPMSYGYRLSYVMRWDSDWRIGANLGMVNSDFNDVNLSAIEVSARADYFLSRWDSWGMDFYGTAEVGILKSTIDFSAVDPQGFETDATAPFVSLLLTAEKNWKTWGLFGKIGYSMNFYDATYEEGNISFNTPFDGGLISIEAGLSYHF